jgi:hypothetical protein
VSLTPEESSDRLLKAITECVGGMVTGFVVMASFMDDDGDRRIYSDTMQDQRCHETIGLLGFGIAVENERAVRSILDDAE